MTAEAGRTVSSRAPYKRFLCTPGPTNFYREDDNGRSQTYNRRQGTPYKRLVLLYIMAVCVSFRVRYYSRSGSD